MTADQTDKVGSISPDFSLSGKLAVITGASTGIGKEIARAFAAAGAEIIVTARTESKLIELKNEVENDMIKTAMISKCLVLN